MEPMNRREFFGQAGAAAGLVRAAGAPQAVSLIADPSDPVASSPPARWALQELQDALQARRIPARMRQRLEQAPASELCMLATGREAPPEPESLSLTARTAGGRTVLTASGRDPRGLVYALLDLADRVRYGAGPLAALPLGAAVVERPANRIRSVTRCFVSDVEDKPWYQDRAFWPPYLSMLAAQRFNRFSLAFGIGYDFTRQIRDCYFHFAYPFLLDVPGYRVRAVPLPDAERDRNFEMLRYISEQTVARGLQFQLALWTHAYQWTDSPDANYRIEGLTPENHAAYCRDALYRVLEACPGISGVTFRVHGESGIAEGSYQFWKTVFDGIVRTGRRIEIDMHAKGMDDQMIQAALSTGLPVNISPKFWAEHMGLPYHQAAIRELEMPRRAEGFFALSSGERRFLRYGYGDLLREDRKYGVLFRIWPGTQRLLLWGDPVFAAGYGRAFQFCGCAGVEICEPLSFKGRKGGGLPGGRTAYADPSLAPRYDFEKYLYTYRLWGRHLYNPETDPETWRRPLRAQFGESAPQVEAALGSASRILPLVTTAHLPSAANNNFWPELYTNMPIVDASRRHPYSDTPAPRRFGSVSPLDPELFSRIDDFVREPGSAKYSPLEVARWLDELAAAADRPLPRSAAAIDVAILAGLGRFYAHKLRAGVFFSLFEQTQDRAALEEAWKAYRAAREAWVKAAKTGEAYRRDITFGYDAHLRGHWQDRLPAIDQDLADLEKLLAGASPAGSPDDRLRRFRTPAPRPSGGCRHTPPGSFQPGQAVALELFVDRTAEARLHYRRVQQAERWQAAEMTGSGNQYRGAIPPDYTRSPFPLQYYFELRDGPAAWLYPGFAPDLANQPYFVIRRASSGVGL